MAAYQLLGTLGGWDGIIAGAAKRVAPGDAPQREPAAFEAAMDL